MVNRSKQIYTGRHWNVVNMVNNDSRAFLEGNRKLNMSISKSHVIIWASQGLIGAQVEELGFWNPNNNLRRS